MKRFQILASNFQFLVRAYQGLKVLFDPAVEGSPYAREIKETCQAGSKRTLVLTRKLSWR